MSARLSYNYRNSCLTRFETRNANADFTVGELYSERVRPVGRLDLSASYNIFENLTLTGDATNILAKPYVSDLTYAFANGTDPVTFPRIVRYEESVYSLGFRFRF